MLQWGAGLGRMGRWAWRAACPKEQRLAQTLPALAGATGQRGLEPFRNPLTTSRGCWLALAEERWFCLLRYLFQASSERPVPLWCCLPGSSLPGQQLCLTIRDLLPCGDAQEGEVGRGRVTPGSPSCLVTSCRSLSREVLHRVPPAALEWVAQPARGSPRAWDCRWGTGNWGDWAVVSILLLSLLQIFGDYYHFRHSGVVKRSLSPHQPWHSRLAREPQVHAAGGPCLSSATAWLWSWALRTGM